MQRLENKHLLRLREINTVIYDRQIVLTDPNIINGTFWRPGLPPGWPTNEQKLEGITGYKTLLLKDIGTL